MRGRAGASYGRPGHERAGDRHRTGREQDRLLKGLPVTERRLRPAGVSTMVLEGGDGPPLVLLHGAIESGGAYWAPVIGGSPSSHRVVVPDVPGLGESEPVGRPDPATLRGLVPRSGPGDLRGPAGARRALDAAARWRRASPYSTETSLSRLVIYAAPGVGPYRIPVGLAIRAIRFGLRPVREERRALRPLRRSSTSTRRGGGTASWLEAFKPLHARAGDGAARQAHDAAVDRERDQAGSRRRAPAHPGPDQSALGAATTASFPSAWRRGRARGSAGRCT